MRVAFNVIDETIWFIDRPHEPWTVQAEARAAGRLDDERLRLAVRSALARHPMARARQAPWRFWQTGFAWEITEDPQVDALSIVDCPDDAALARVRSDLYGRPVPLATSPPLRVRLAHHAAGDVVLLGVNHAASDGLGTLRPRERRHEVVGNFSSFVTVATDPEDRRRPAATVAAVTAQSRRVKAGGPPGALVDVLASPLPGPLVLKEVTWGLLPFVLERGLDTAVLSNLGRLDEPLSFGADAGDAAEVWFSPPARMPVGLALGAVTIGRRLHLSFRYRHPLFGPGAAARFATRYVEALDRLAA